MDKKMSRRIVGTLVLLALAIIVLPLVMGNENKSLIQSANLTTPAFPVSDHSAKTDEQMQMARLPESKMHKSMEKILSPKASLASLQAPIITTPVMQLKTLTPMVKVAAVEKKPVVEAVVTVAPVKTETQTLVKTVASAAPAVDDNKKIATVSEAVAPVADNTTIPKANVSPRANWVVQLGSFKNKKNAERLKAAVVSKGFNAYTFETKRNGQTRVYVGPEEQHASAKELADKIQAAMKIPTVVLSL